MHGTINGLPRISRMTWAGLGIMVVTLLGRRSEVRRSVHIGQYCQCRAKAFVPSFWLAIADLLLVTLTRAMPIDPLQPHFQRASARPSVAQQKAA
jgi:hypothetical protein